MRPSLDENHPAQGHDSLGDEFGNAGHVSKDTVPEGPPDEQVGNSDRLRRWRKPLLLFAPLLLVLGGLYAYLSGGRYQSTENASIQSGLVSISPNVAGRVVAVEVRNNQRVRTGQVLFRLDPAPFETKVREAEALLSQARTDVLAQRADYRKGIAQLTAARAQVDYAEREQGRQKELFEEGISSQNQYDQARLATRTAGQNVESAAQQNAAIEARLSGNVKSPIDGQPGVKAAQAALDQARLDLAYTVVRAPQDGIAAKVDQLQVGDYVSASRPVFSLAGTRMWVEANFKEDQLQYMRLRQPATVRIDAFPSLDLRAHVTSFSPGTGNSFSVLPAENATGNWVKVVQRLPVELTLDRLPDNIPLHAGLSVEVTVDTGHERRLFGPDVPPGEPKAARP